MTNQITSIEQQAIEEVQAYAESVGLGASTVCVRATGNSRLLQRFKSRAKQTEKDLKRLRAFMAENPPKQGGAAR